MYIVPKDLVMVSIWCLVCPKVCDFFTKEITSLFANSRFSIFMSRQAPRVTVNLKFKTSTKWHGEKSFAQKIKKAAKCAKI